MVAVSFATRSFQVVDGPSGPDVVLGTLVTPGDARTLAAALAWRRSKDHLATAAETADDVLALRGIIELVDQLEALADSGANGGPLTLRQDQVARLTEAAATYIAERDGGEYQPPAERDRLAQLRSLSDALFDLVAAFAGARAELHEHTTGR